MKISTMRTLDCLAGIPMCAAASLFTNKKAPEIGQLLQKEKIKILIIHLSEMGAAVPAQPAIAELRRRLPQAELYFLSFPIAQALFQTLKNAPADHCLTIDPTTPVSLAGSALKSLQVLRSAGIDCVLDFEGYSRVSAILGALICPKGIRVGMHPYQLPHLYRGSTLTHKVLYTPHRHISHFYWTLVSALFADPDNEPFPQIPPSDFDPEKPIPYEFSYRPDPEDEACIERKLALLNLNACQDLVIVNPNSSDMLPLRKWPLERYAQVIAYLRAYNPKTAFIVTGTANERAGFMALASKLPDCQICDFTGQTTLPQLLALYRRCRLLITNDSGPAHLAPIVGLPSVVLYGPETPKLFAPLGDRTKIIYENWLCSPCVCPANGKNSLCKTGGCLKAVSVEKVVAAAIEQMNKYPGPKSI
ncbi:glycosyltransferase family 9 protein [bacterium]|nr:glycosyltransferase family 9 protein [bacterium]